MTRALARPVRVLAAVALLLLARPWAGASSAAAARRGAVRSRPEPRRGRRQSGVEYTCVTEHCANENLLCGFLDATGCGLLMEQLRECGRGAAPRRPTRPPHVCIPTPPSHAHRFSFAPAPCPNARMCAAHMHTPRARTPLLSTAMPGTTSATRHRHGRWRARCRDAAAAFVGGGAGGGKNKHTLHAAPVQVRGRAPLHPGAHDHNDRRHRCTNRRRRRRGKVQPGKM